VQRPRGPTTRTTGRSRQWLHEAPPDRTSRTPRPKAGLGRAAASASRASHRLPGAPALAGQRESAVDAAALPAPSAAAIAAATAPARAVVQRPPAVDSLRVQLLARRRCLSHCVARYRTQLLFRKNG